VPNTCCTFFRKTENFSTQSLNETAQRLNVYSRQHIQWPQNHGKSLQKMFWPQQVPTYIIAYRSLALLQPCRTQPPACPVEISPEQNFIRLISSTALWSALQGKQATSPSSPSRILYTEFHYYKTAQNSPLLIWHGHIHTKQTIKSHPSFIFYVLHIHRKVRR
jgi:hypothetical protein